MINNVRARSLKESTEYIIYDFGEDDWMSRLKSTEAFDLIISGYSIHHIEKNEVLWSIEPNGLFLNLEHFSSPTERIEELFNDIFFDGISDYQESIGDKKTMEEIKNMYHDPNHKQLNKLASVENQCEWLRETGFNEVDCFTKIF
jgi:hypothetical protein